MLLSEISIFIHKQIILLPVMTTKIKRILVPVDFTATSEKAVSKAIIISKVLRAEIFLLHVLDYNPYQFSVVPENQFMFPSITELEKALAKKMDAMRTSIRKKHKINPEINVTTGHIDSEIIRFSKKKNIDLIIMGTHGASGYKELFIGSNSQRVVTLSDIPVLTIQKKVHKPGFKHILIPIDNSLHSREKVNIAIHMAELFGAKLHILGLPNSNEKTTLNKFKIKIESVENAIKAHHLSYKTTYGKGNNLAATAMNYAEKSNCDLIIINTGHESQITGIFLGTFAQQIVNHARIPVLSVRHIADHFTVRAPVEVF